MFANPVTEAIWRRRSRWCPPDQVANAFDTAAVVTPPSQAPADAVKAAWKPVQAGQAIPMVGEVVGYVQPFCDE